MPENAIRHAFNDKAPPMSITVLNLTEASSLLRTIHKRDIKDVRAIDLDLALVMENGHKIIISRGAVAAANTPQLVLEFADGDVAIGDVFEKLNHIEVPPETAGTFTVSETKRYGIKRVSKPKSAKNDQDQESDKDNHDEGAAGQRWRRNGCANGPDCQCQRRGQFFRAGRAGYPGGRSQQRRQQQRRRHLLASDCRRPGPAGRRRRGWRWRWRRRRCGPECAGQRRCHFRRCGAGSTQQRHHHRL